MTWINKLQDRWHLKNTAQVVIVLIVFACTGFTVMFLKDPIVDFFTDEGEPSVWFSVIYYVLILPIYNIILLFYGLIFGQFRFFWEFEKRMFGRFKRRKKDAQQR
ncbi:MAG: Na+-driven multidrug efflux pump [Cyclobacteriaceae bacterium]|jgi:Na+-driven multidrug efflux pump